MPRSRTDDEHAPRRSPPPAAHTHAHTHAQHATPSSEHAAAHGTDTSASQRALPLVVLALGPIGVGKTTFAQCVADALCDGGVRAQHIDGDVLDMTLEQVLQLRAERNPLTMWHVLRALADGIVPVLSTGGGVLFDTPTPGQSAAGAAGGAPTRTLSCLLRSHVAAAFHGMQVRVALLLPSGRAPKDNAHDAAAAGERVLRVLGARDDDSRARAAGSPLDAVYSDRWAVQAAVRRRLASGEWKLPPGADMDGFVARIAALSQNNAAFARHLLLHEADVVVTFPALGGSDFVDGQLVAPWAPAGTSGSSFAAMPEALRRVALASLASVPPPPHVGRFRQRRALVYVRELSRFGHITLDYDSERHIEGPQRGVDEAYAGGRTLRGTVWRLLESVRDSPSDGASIELVLVDGLDDELGMRAHITLHAGVHEPRFMGEVAVALREGRHQIELPSRVAARGHYVTYQLPGPGGVESAPPSAACTVELHGVFYIAV